MTRCVDCRDRDAETGDGLCPRCYDRRRRGLPRIVTLRQVGEPDGHGQYGILDVDDDSVLCHECGRRMVRLGRHLAIHGMTAAEYREAHGLPRQLPLAALGYRRAASVRVRARLGSPAWLRLVAARDPGRASRMRGRIPASAATVAAQTGRPNPGTGRTARVRSCPFCSAEYTGRGRSCGAVECVRQARAAASRGKARPRALTDAERAQLLAVEGAERDAMVRAMQQAGVSSRSLGAALGMADWLMSDRYPR